MAKAAKPKKTKQGPKGDHNPGTGGNYRSVVWLSGLACGMLAMVAPGLAILAAGLLAPGLVALKLDREPGRPVARTIMTFGLAACVQPVMTLWNSGQSFNAAIAIVTDPAVAGMAWSAAAAGWLLTQLMPLAIRAVLEATTLARATRLRAARLRLAEAWGLPPAPTDQSAAQ
jgi:hypothetical protein